MICEFVQSTPEMRERERMRRRNDEHRWLDRRLDHEFFLEDLERRRREQRRLRPPSLLHRIAIRLLLCCSPTPRTDRPPEAVVSSASHYH